MTYRGRVQNGVIVVEGGTELPEGIGVLIELEDSIIEVASPSRENSEPTIGQKLAALARKFEKPPCDLPEDLAVNHDHYLHGVPKRR